MAASCLYDAYPAILAIQFSIIRSHSPKWYHTDSKFHTKARITASQGRLIQHLDMICLVELVASPRNESTYFRLQVWSWCGWNPNSTSDDLLQICTVPVKYSRSILTFNKTDLLKGRMNLILFGWIGNGWYEGWILVKMNGSGWPSCKLPLCLSWKSLLQNS